jgi:hypothetical protein
MLPAPECPRKRWERFLAGTQPTQPDSQFQRLVIDRGTGQLATDTTPADRRGERVYWLLPPEYHDWMIGQGIAIAPVTAAGITVEPGTPAASAAGGAAPASGRSQPAGPLQLASPASYTAYQLHPSVPGESQRLEAVGYTTDGRAWHNLRLMLDGQAIAVQSGSTRLEAWWPMTLGAHTIWLEGEREQGGETIRSQVAQINVDPFTTQSVTMQVVN